MLNREFSEALDLTHPLHRLPTAGLSATQSAAGRSAASKMTFVLDTDVVSHLRQTGDSEP